MECRRRESNTTDAARDTSVKLSIIAADRSTKDGVTPLPPLLQRIPTAEAQCLLIAAQKRK